jgi:hypothetical protein
VEHREDQAQIAGDRRLQRQQRLDRALDPQEQPVDLVVEGDDLARELDIPLLEGPHRAVDGGNDALALFLELGLDAVEGFVNRHW